MPQIAYGLNPKRKFFGTQFRFTDNVYSHNDLLQRLLQFLVWDNVNVDLGCLDMKLYFMIVLLCEGVLHHQGIDFGIGVSGDTTFLWAVKKHGFRQFVHILSYLWQHLPCFWNYIVH